MDWGDTEGGFINDSTFDEPQQVTNSVSVGGGDEKNKSIAAVSVSQIAKLTRPNEGLIIHGRKIYHVNLVAFVKEILDNTPQKIHLLVDDFTSGGPLEVSHIIGDSGTPGEDSSLSMFPENYAEPEDTEERSLSSIQAGDYLRFIGVVKTNQDRPNLVAYNMRFIEDPNFIPMHILEVIRDSLKYSDLQSGAPRLPVGVDSKPAPMNQMRQANDGFGKLSTREKHLLKFLQERATSEQGIHFKEIAENFKAFTRDDIEKSLQTLSAEGFCWNGDTEEYWCVNRTDI